MPAHLTPAQAKALGIDPSDARKGTGAGRSRRGGGRSAPSPTECHGLLDDGSLCRTRCDGETAQAKHQAATGHARYQLLITFDQAD